MIKLLIVDDSALVRKVLGDVFGRASDFEVEYARTGVEALARIPHFNPDVITLDVNMPEMDGLACLDQIMLQHPRPVVMVSSVTNEGADATLEAMRLGAIDVIAKPSDAVSLDLHELAPQLIERVRDAASIRVSRSRRLSDRIRHRATMRSERAPTASVRSGKPADVTLEGEGVVVIGVSTGGPPALEAILPLLNADFGWPVVVAQHMPPTFTGALARRLDKLCALSVSEVVKPTRIEPGNVYIARGGADIVISRRATGLIALPAPARAGYLWQPSVDRLVRTAMEQLPPHKILAVMLTGMGSDGAAAMTALHAQGGHVIAESEDSAVVWGMPGEVVRNGGAQWVLPAGEMADLLNQLASTCP